MYKFNNYPSNYQIFNKNNPSIYIYLEFENMIVEGN